MPGRIREQIFAGIATALLIGATVSCRHNQPPNPNENWSILHTVVDETGRSLVLPVRPTRIVSLAPSLTEIVFAVGGGSQLVGDTTYCDYPEEAKHVAKIGDTLHPNLEAIVALKPDLVLISTSSQLESFSHELNAQHIAYYISDPKNLDQVLKSVSAIGAVLDHNSEAHTLVDELHRRESHVIDAVKDIRPVSVFYQVSAEPLYTAGRDSFVTDLLRKAGGISVTESVPGAWPRYSDESALAANPEAIVIPSGDSMGGGRELAPANVFRKSRAVIEKRVYQINGDLLSRPGPRLVEGLEQLAKALHPEIDLSASDEGGK